MDKRDNIGIIHKTGGTLLVALVFLKKNFVFVFCCQPFFYLWLIQFNLERLNGHKGSKKAVTQKKNLDTYVEHT